MNTTLPQKFSQYWNTVQSELIAQLTNELGPLTASLLAVIRTLECARIDEFVEPSWYGLGRPRKDRLALARAFIAKSILHLRTTEALRERLHIDRSLQRICGFDTRKALPDAATFSRAFAEMAKGRVGERCHQVLIEATLGDQLIGHRPTPPSVLPALTRQNPQPQGPYVAPSPQNYSGLKPSGTTLTCCFIYVFRVVPTIKKGLTADIFYGIDRTCDRVRDKMPRS